MSRGASRPGRRKWTRRCRSIKELPIALFAWYNRFVNLTISIPDEFGGLLGSSMEERERHACEALAMELYREGKISLRRMGEMAGVGGDHWAADRLRASRNAPLNYSAEDLEGDREAAKRLLP